MSWWVGFHMLGKLLFNARSRHLAKTIPHGTPPRFYTHSSIFDTLDLVCRTTMPRVMKLKREETTHMKLVLVVHIEYKVFHPVHLSVNPTMSHMPDRTTVIQFDEQLLETPMPCYVMVMLVELVTKKLQPTGGKILSNGSSIKQTLPIHHSHKSDHASHKNTRSHAQQDTGSMRGGGVNCLNSKSKKRHDRRWCMGKRSWS